MSRVCLDHFSVEEGTVFTFYMQNFCILRALCLFTFLRLILLSYLPLHFVKIFLITHKVLSLLYKIYYPNTSLFFGDFVSLFELQSHVACSPYDPASFMENCKVTPYLVPQKLD